MSKLMKFSDLKCGCTFVIVPRKLFKGCEQTKKVVSLVMFVIKASVCTFAQSLVLRHTFVA